MSNGTSARTTGALSRVLVATGANARANFGDILPAFNVAHERNRFLSAAGQVVLDLGGALEIVRNRAVDLAEGQRGIAVLNLLRRGPLLKRVNKRIQRHATSRNADGSVCFLNERRDLRQRKLHMTAVYVRRRVGPKPATVRARPRLAADPTGMRELAIRRHHIGRLPPGRREAAAAHDSRQAQW